MFLLLGTCQRRTTWASVGIPRFVYSEIIVQQLACCIFVNSGLCFREMFIQKKLSLSALLSWTLEMKHLESRDLVSYGHIYNMNLRSGEPVCSNMTPVARWPISVLWLWGSSCISIYSFVSSSVNTPWISGMYHASSSFGQRYGSMFMLIGISCTSRTAPERWNIFWYVDVGLTGFNAVQLGRWKHYVPHGRWYLPKRPPHGLTSWKINFDIFTPWRPKISRFLIVEKFNVLGET
jgi:hypothetical protein